MSTRYVNDFPFAVTLYVFCSKRYVTLCSKVSFFSNVSLTLTKRYVNLSCHFHPSRYAFIGVTLCHVMFLFSSVSPSRYVSIGVTLCLARYVLF
jgi:hypothetical protein